MGTLSSQVIGGLEKCLILHQPMTMFAPTVPVPEAGAELHRADGPIEHFQNKFKKLNILLLCLDSVSNLYFWNSFFSFSLSPSFSLSLF